MVEKQETVTIDDALLSRMEEVRQQAATNQDASMRGAQGGLTKVAMIASRVQEDAARQQEVLVRAESARRLRVRMVEDANMEMAQTARLLLDSMKELAANQVTMTVFLAEAEKKARLPRQVKMVVAFVAAAAAVVAAYAGVVLMLRS
jgi:hypothetical protein